MGYILDKRLKSKNVRKKVKIDSVYIFFLYYSNTEMCNCNPSFDVRCTCWVNDKGWKKCPQRWATAYWRINNWSEFYENGDVSWDKHKKYILKTCRFNENDWKILLDMKETEEQERRELDEDNEK